MKSPLSPTRQFFLTNFWFAYNFHWSALLVVVVQSQVYLLAPEALRGRALGLVLGGGAILSMLAQPFFGGLSDHSHSRWGRRRPQMTLGIVINLVALYGLFSAAAHGRFIEYVAWYFLLIIANNAMGSAYTALVPDLVNEDQRGAVSSWIGFMSVLGTIAAARAANRFMGSDQPHVMMWVIVGVVGIFFLMTVFGLKEPPAPPARPFHLKEMFSSFRFDFRAHPSFGWLCLSRMSILFTFYTVMFFLEYFLRDVVHVANPERSTGLLLEIASWAALGSAVLAGFLSDRVGRRAIVYFAGTLMAVAALMFAAQHSEIAIRWAAVVFGFGYGAFAAVDWAMVTDVLPGADSYAKDMGIWTVSTIVPQIVSTLLGGWIIDHFNARVPELGYRILHAIVMVVLISGVLIIGKARGLRPWQWTKAGKTQE
ncbi:MAG: MFS transporter [Acidobacteriia bacterium]|nr:MFS transporter [Terriglobia bacterium]